MVDLKTKKPKATAQDVSATENVTAPVAESKAKKLTIEKTVAAKPSVAKVNAPSSLTNAAQAKSAAKPVNTLHTGRRKNAMARVMVKPGTGNIIINKLNVEKYFPRESHRHNLLKPFAVTKTLGQFDVVCTVKGGGHTGQSGAILLGIARALDKIDETFRPLLKQDGLLTRDARVVERKKYGQRKARKSTQFSKR